MFLCTVIIRVGLSLCYACIISRLMIVSREARKKQAVHNKPSELFTGSTTLKLVNALNKPPLKLSLSYQGLSTF